MEAGDTITVQGAGGAVFEFDVPDDGTVQREVFDTMLAKGELAVVDAPKPKPASGKGKAKAPAEDTPPEAVVDAPKPDPEAEPDGG